VSSSICADLHIHTDASDGQMCLREVVGTAAQIGLRAIAITDHDRLHPQLDARISHSGGVEVIRGVEIRVTLDDVRVDLLGYGVTRTPQLDAMLRRIQRSRIERAAAMIRSLEDALDVTLGLSPSPGIGRPTIAAAVVAAVDGYTIDRVFTELIGADCPHYVRRWVPDAAVAIDTLRAADALISLAHPYRYPDFDAATAAIDRLDAIEAFYPYGTDRQDLVDLGRLEQMAAAADLLLTGGSDAHGRTLGAAGVDVQTYDRFRSALMHAG
jgi:Predicted metal-dependent phosphoesterases (PHP family)